MNALRATLRTLGVLSGLWLALIGTGFGFGVIPGLPFYRGDRGPLLTGERRVDAPSRSTSAADGGTPPQADAGTPHPEPVEFAPPVAPRPSYTRFVVCPEPAIAPSLSTLDLLGDGRTQLAIGCGTHWEIIAVLGSVPVRIARIDAPAGDEESSPATGAALAVAIDGNESRDLVLPFARYGAGGATRAGGLYIVPRDEFGGFDRPRALAPIAAVAAAAGTLDGNATDDVVGLHLVNPLARLPSEAWVFLGGPSPSRRAVLRASSGAQSLAVIDIDRDRQLDVLIGSSEDSRLDVFFAPGRGGAARHHTLSIPSIAQLAVGDVTGDGAADAVALAAGVVVVPATDGGTLSAMRLESSSPSMRGLDVANLDDDPADEIVVWDAPRFTVLDVVEGRTEMRVLAELGSRDFGTRRHRIADVDGNGEAELVLLGTSAIDGERALELVIVPKGEQGTFEVGERLALGDAPLLLRVKLPDAQAP